MSLPPRPPAVAGRFYPARGEALRDTVDELLDAAGPAAGDHASDHPPLLPDQRIVAAVVPHAGYIYSGGVAGAVYRSLRGREFEASVLIGPDHFMGFGGAAVYARGSFATPLGEVTIHEEFATRILAAGPPIVERPDIHGREHSLEVQLPFLQRVLPGGPIVPILLGRPDPKAIRLLATALMEIAQNRPILVVASTDLSHYHPRARARQLDEVVLHAIREVSALELLRALADGRGEACGGGALATALTVARELGVVACQDLVYADSGDVNDDPASVVGYVGALLATPAAS